MSGPGEEEAAPTIQDAPVGDSGDSAPGGELEAPAELPSMHDITTLVPASGPADEEATPTIQDAPVGDSGDSAPGGELEAPAELPGMHDIEMTGLAPLPASEDGEDNELPPYDDDSAESLQSETSNLLGRACLSTSLGKWLVTYWQVMMWSCVVLTVCAVGTVVLLEVVFGVFTPAQKPVAPFTPAAHPNYPPLLLPRRRSFEKCRCINNDGGWWGSYTLCSPPPTGFEFGGRREFHALRCTVVGNKYTYSNHWGGNDNYNTQGWTDCEGRCGPHGVSKCT